MDLNTDVLDLRKSLDLGVWVGALESLPPLPPLPPPFNTGIGVGALVFNTSVATGVTQKGVISPFPLTAMGGCSTNKNKDFVTNRDVDNEHCTIP